MVIIEEDTTPEKTNVFSVDSESLDMNMGDVQKYFDGESSDQNSKMEDIKNYFANIIKQDVEIIKSTETKTTHTSKRFKHHKMTKTQRRRKSRR